MAASRTHSTFAGNSYVTHLTHTLSCVYTPKEGRKADTHCELHRGWVGGQWVCTHTNTHTPIPFSANANSETTHGSRESRRLGKAHKYTRILYYINTHAGLYKYRALRLGVLHKYTAHDPQPPPTRRAVGREGEKRGCQQ